MFCRHSLNRYHFSVARRVLLVSLLLLIHSSWYFKLNCSNTQQKFGKYFEEHKQHLSSSSCKSPRGVHPIVRGRGCSSYFLGVEIGDLVFFRASLGLEQCFPVFFGYFETLRYFLGSKI